MSANNNNAATASGNASLASAGLISQAIGQGINAFGLMRGQSSYGGGTGTGQDPGFPAWG